MPAIALTGFSGGFRDVQTHAVALETEMHDTALPVTGNTVANDAFVIAHIAVWIDGTDGKTAALKRQHPACISELPYHSNKPPGRHPYTPKANNR